MLTKSLRRRMYSPPLLRKILDEREICIYSKRIFLLAPMSIVSYQSCSTMRWNVFTEGLHHDTTLRTNLDMLSIFDTVEKLEKETRQSRARSDSLSPVKLNVRSRTSESSSFVEETEYTVTAWCPDSNRSTLLSNLERFSLQTDQFRERRSLESVLTWNLWMG